jgi:glutathione S-transferase
VRQYPFFAADHYTVADIALYAYTHIAHEVGFDLTGFPSVRAWLKRVAEQPGHVGMDWQPARMAIAG